MNRPPIRRGQAQHCAILCPEAIRDIRVRVARGESDASVARRYHVNPSTIRDVKQGKTWRHVP